MRTCKWTPPTHTYTMVGGWGVVSHLLYSGKLKISFQSHLSHEKKGKCVMTRKPLSGQSESDFDIHISTTLPFCEILIFSKEKKNKNLFHDYSYL